MKTINTLIRVHKQRLDDKRIRLVEIENERDRLRRSIDDLAAELESEKRTAATSYDAAQTFTAYAARIGERRRAYENEMIAIGSRIVKVAEEVAEAFRELKKYEISRDLRQDRENMLEARREQALFDEIGSAIRRRGRIDVKDGDRVSRRRGGR